MIWIQIVCKGYQQTTLVGKELNLHVQLYSGARCLVFGVIWIQIVCEGYQQMTLVGRVKQVSWMPGVESCGQMELQTV